jgi:hypothetical protein
VTSPPRLAGRPSTRSTETEGDVACAATTDIALSNSLADLAARIRIEHEGARAAVRRGIQHAMAAGDLLIEAKAQLKHGQWLPWLRDHCSMPDRTARLYMRLAKGRGVLEAENGNVADLSLRGALDLLAPSDADDDPDPYEGLPPRPLADGEFYMPIGGVKFRPDLYPRLEFIRRLVERYGEFLRDLPAIEANQHNELIDGWHRWEAHKKAGARTIRVRVTVVGSEQPACGWEPWPGMTSDMDHRLTAIRRNATHGLQLPIEVERELRDERVAAEVLERSKASAELATATPPTPSSEGAPS